MSEYEPMWSDPTETPAAAPLTLAEVAALRAPTAHGFSEPLGGDTVRVVDRGGRVAQGTITRTFGYRVHAPTEFTVGGKTWSSSWATFYRAPAGAPELVAAPLKLTADALRDLIADLSEDLSDSGQATAVSIDAIVRRALGYDPSISRPGAEHRGKSKSGWINEHFSLSAMKNAAAELCDAGVLRAVNYGVYGSPSADRPFVSFSYGTKTGWVLTSLFDAAREAVAARQDTALAARLLDQARQNVADRHTDEVQAELLVLRAAHVLVNNNPKEIR